MLAVNIKSKLIKLLMEYEDCFAWDYHEMLGLNRQLAGHCLPINAGKKLVKQLPRNMTHEIMLKVKEEVEKLLATKFIEPI